MKPGHWLALLCLLLLQACGAPERRSVADLAAIAPAPQQWLAAGGSVPVQRLWWQGFGDPVLAGLVDEALARNLDLRQAAARLAEARALARVQDAAAWPTLDFGVGAERARSISEVTGRPFLSDNYQGQFIAAYEVDLWGRIADLRSAAQASADATAAARDAVALSVAATAAASYIQLRAFDARLELARRTLASRERSLALTRSREQRGYGSGLESAQAEAELRATAQAIPQLEQAIEHLERSLNVLLARTPGPIERGAPLLALTDPGLPAGGLPSTLMRRRPDIYSAELQLAATDAQLAAARAQMLPSVHLSATLGRAGASVLRGDPFALWSVGDSVLAPLFNGGRLRSLADASASRRDQALIAYERSVLTAFAEVETQLSAYAFQSEQLVQAQGQRVALEDALRIAGRRYREGFASYLDELLAQRNLFAVEQNVLQLNAELLATEVNLYRALGGGWTAQDQVSQLP
ncbi:efflux transporter outer membrane subunit [Variovorax sp. J22R133]|uniref:efflux transporter outer membrane subunit n=1 Tax=Variovorax brevis TaxID=3053503 RepID=UPI0025767DEE|nr:efflux transporter outer membrane subunit [Variovorax sp. J22R133]MDM0112325.1 efflux transporter outer membrane subunit [Variovorax sp. J22R133]